MYAQILKYVLMPLYEQVKGKDLLRSLNEYQQHLSWSPEQIKAYQWQQLQLLLSHAFEHTTYYPKVWKQVGVESVADIKNFADFTQLPIITKSDITEHYQEFKSDNYSNNIKKATGGSTGQPFRFELDVNSNTRREAIMWRGYGWLGAGLGVKTLYLWGADLGQPSNAKTLKDALYHRFYNRKMLNSFAMNQGNMKAYVANINAYKPVAMVCYVNPLYELARFVLQQKISIWSPKTILTGAEALHEFQREVIEEAFNCSVYNTFGCREFMLISAECQAHNNLHINSDHLVVETLDDASQPVNGEVGDLVITDLFNYAMPLIRYVNGDQAILTDKQCDCGNPLPLMHSISGRKLDIIKTSDGGTIPGELFPHMLKEFTGVERFQVIQDEVTSIAIKLVVNEHFSPSDQDNIVNEINKYSQGKLQIKFDLVDDIPLTKSGKHRVTICHC